MGQAGAVGEAVRPVTLPRASRPRSSWRLDAVRVSLVILVLVDVSRIHQHYRFLAVFRPMQLMAAGALIYAYLNPKLLVDLRIWSKLWPARVVAALGVVACFSVLFGISLGSSARFFVEEYVKVLVMAFLLMSAIRNSRDLALLVWAYVAACGVLVWMALFVFGLQKGGNAGDIYHLGGLYLYDGNDVCVVLLAGLGFCLFTYQTSGRFGKVASAVIMLGIGDVIARTGSRGGFLGLVAFGAAFLLMPSKTSLVKRVVMIGAVALGLQFGSPEGYWTRILTVLHPKEDYNWSSPTGRRMAAKRGLEYMRQYPVFGIGLMNFPRAEGTISERAKTHRSTDPGIRWMVPHNSYIQAGAEMGYPGGILWTSILVCGAASCWRLRRRLRARWARGDREQRLLYSFTQAMPLSIIGFGVSAFFVSFAYLSPIYILAAYVTGMHVAVRERQNRDSATAQATIRQGVTLPAQGPSALAMVRPARQGRVRW